MATVGLHIILESDRGEFVTIARVKKRALLLDAAGVALLEAEQLAERMASEDSLLGELQRDEAGRLRRALECILPELRPGGPVQ
jgi:hypothetical protein